MESRDEAVKSERQNAAIVRVEFEGLKVDTSDVSGGTELVMCCKICLFEPGYCQVGNRGQHPTYICSEIHHHSAVGYRKGRSNTRAATLPSWS